MKSIVIVTEDRYEQVDSSNPYQANILQEEMLLKTAFEAQGIVVDRKSWSNPDVNWSQYDAAVLRSTWDYFFRFHEFELWLKRISTQTQVINGLDLLLWNAHKGYLLALQDKGIAIAPSMLLKKGTKIDLDACVETLQSSELIFKPCISGAAKHTYRVNRATELKKLQELVNVEDYLIQAFVPEILSRGEVSLIFFDGAYSHAVLKQAKEGDFRVQDDFGGSVSLFEPGEDLLNFAKQVLQKCPKMPSYARVDICQSAKGPLLMELELIEPELWFRLYPPAIKSMMHAIIR